MAARLPLRVMSHQKCNDAMQNQNCPCACHALAIATDFCCTVSPMWQGHQMLSRSTVSRRMLCSSRKDPEVCSKIFEIGAEIRGCACAIFGCAPHVKRHLPTLLQMILDHSLSDLALRAAAIDDILNDLTRKDHLCLQQSRQVLKVCCLLRGRSHVRRDISTINIAFYASTVSICYR